MELTVVATNEARLQREQGAERREAERRRLRDHLCRCVACGADNTNAQAGGPMAVCPEGQLLEIRVARAAGAVS